MMTMSAYLKFKNLKFYKAYELLELVRYSTANTHLWNKPL
jgi:hypothetical protein